MTDFKLKVTAETDDAKKKLNEIAEKADSATKERPIKIEIPNYSQLQKNFKDLQQNAADAANTIQQFYRIASKIPGSPVQQINEVGAKLKNVSQAANESGRSFSDAGDVIKNTLKTAGDAASALVGKLTRIAFSLYVINEAAQAASQAFGGLFNETIGREIKLRETILKTQTTLASTNKVFSNGKEITDPYQKIVSLTGAVKKNIDSIRERSIALAGVTSNDVIEVFGMVASQVGQIGGGLKEAEDLAINFAAALGTFGIPLYQARQEIGSILRGDITQDSYLAKSLGITNEDIAKAKTEAGGVIKFLENRLSAAVAGQKIAAEGFSGVVSNLRDLSELINQNFGAGLLDPLLDGLTKVFEFVFEIRTQLFDIAKLAGKSIGTIVQLGAGTTLGASGVSKSGGQAVEAALGATQTAIERVTTEINKAFSGVYLQLSTLAERASLAFGALTKGLANLALGLLNLKLKQLQAIVGAIEALSPALLAAANVMGGFLGLWGKFMEMPVVQEFTQLSAIMRALEATGVMPLIRNGFILMSVIDNWSKITQFVITQFNLLRAVIGGIIAALGTAMVSIQRSGAVFLTAWLPASVALQAVKQELIALVAQSGIVGEAFQKLGSKLGSLNTQQGRFGKGIVGLIGNMIRFNLIMFALSAAMSVIIERYSAWKESQDNIASSKRAAEALKRLSTTYRNVGEDASSATKRARDYEQALVDAQYDKNIDALEKIREKINQIRYELKPGIQSWSEFWDAASGREVGEFEQGRREDMQRSLKEEARLKAALNAVDQERDKQDLENKITLEADKRKNIEKEITDMRRSIENDLFQQRQERALKEVDIFLAAGELRIYQMEMSNKKLLEGEEGASEAAMTCLLYASPSPRDATLSRMPSSA